MSYLKVSLHTAIALAISLSAGAVPPLISTSCAAIEIDEGWSQARGAIITLCNSELTIIQNGKHVFSSHSLANDDEGTYVSVDSIGKPIFDTKQKRVILPFAASEEAPEYMGKAKGFIYLDETQWRAACAGDVCEALPNKKAPAKEKQTRPTTKKCQAQYVTRKNGDSGGIIFGGCKGSGKFFIVAAKQVAFPFDDLELEGSVDFYSMKTIVQKKKEAFIPMTVVENVIRPGAGMGDAEEETARSKARLHLTSALGLRCAQKNCLMLPK
jgi:hypothetical protein